MVWEAGWGGGAGGGGDCEVIWRYMTTSTIHSFAMLSSVILMMLGSLLNVDASAPSCAIG